MRLKIGTRLRLSFASVIGLVLCVGAIGYASMSRISDELRGSLGIAFQTSSEVADLRLVAREARLLMAASAASGTTSDLRTVEVLSKRFQEDLAAVAHRLPPSIHPDELSRLMATAVSVGQEYAKASAQQQWSRSRELGPEFTRASAAIEWYLEDAQRAERSWVEERLQAVSGELHRRALYFGAPAPTVPCRPSAMGVPIRA